MAHAASPARTLLTLIAGLLLTSAHAQSQSGLDFEHIAREGEMKY
ncbi:MAG: hypothetical protein RJA77_1057, partial [Pseudomonadota bacterium]